MNRNVASFDKFLKDTGQAPSPNPAARIRVQDLRSPDATQLDADTASAYDTWIKSFVDDLVSRYKGIGIRADVELSITLRDRPHV